jgi:DNA sulfur modification protein DndB
VFHDYQDEIAQLTREMIPQVCVFASTTEMARSAISNRSRKLFTLSALYHANRTLLADKKDNPYEANVQIAVSFWSHIASVIPDWGNAARGEIAPAELRRSCVHAHAIALAALSRVGRAVLERNEKSWQTKLARLKSFDWSRSNIGLWEGRAMIGGRLSKSTSSVILTGNAIKLHLGLPLSPEEQQLEAHYARNK